MRDLRHTKLADIIVNYSLKLQPGEKVLIRGGGFVTAPLLKAVIKAVKDAGALPIYKLEDETVFHEWLKNANTEMLTLAAEADVYQMKLMDAFISISAPENALGTV